MAQSPGSAGHRAAGFGRNLLVIREVHEVCDWQGFRYVPRVDQVLHASSQRVAMGGNGAKGVNYQALAGPRAAGKMMP